MNKFFIIDVLMDDLEDFDQIISLLNNPEIGWVKEDGGNSFSEGEVIEELAYLAKSCYIECWSYDKNGAHLQLDSSPSLDKKYLQECWFKLTEKGRKEGEKSPASLTTDT